MTRQCLVCLMFIGFFTGTLKAQKNISGLIRARVLDTIGKQSMAEATIAVVDNKDSSSVAFTTANEKGNFEISGLEAGTYRLLVSFQGYQTIVKHFSIVTNKQVVDLGTLYMEKQSALLQEVFVERPPISIKKDTIEFNANSFKTKPNATVEDLLKKLPGVQVDKDGNVKAQGEQIQKVYVDGKEFFGTDPKLATKNLTADMVESVQVFDDMSDQAKFTKIDDGSRQKAMNIKLKKDKKNGYFGKINGGAGTEGRYDNSLSFNRFKGNTQVSVIGAANNTNKQGFSFSDIISTMGGLGGALGQGQGSGGLGAGMGQLIFSRGGAAGFGFGGGNNGGLTSSASTGINYRDSWGPKIDISGSYFFSQTKNNSVQNIYRQTIFPNDSTTYSNDDKTSENQNINHRFNMRFEFRIDSMNSILYTPSLTLQHSDGFSNDTSTIISQKGVQKYLALTGNSYNDNSRDGINLNNNLLYRRRLNKVGRTFTLGASNTYNHSDGKGNNISPEVLFRPDGSILSTFLSQNYRSSQTTNSSNNILSASYTEPVGKNKLIEFNYAYTNNQSNSDKRTNNYDSLSGKYEIPNNHQTNYFKNSFIANRIGGNFRVQQKKYNYQVGGSIQYSTLESQVFNNGSSKDSVVIRNYVNFTPNASFNYNPKLGTNFRFNYRGRTNQPSTSQLQNVQDFSNPQNIRVGNPDLKQEFAHNLNVGYNTFKLANFQYLAVNFNGGITQNKIVNSIDTLIHGAQISRPINLNGAYTTFAFFTYGKTLKKIKGGNVNTTTVISRNRDVSLLYKQKNYANTWLITQSVSLNYNRKQIDISFNGSVTYTSTQYSLQQTLDNHYYIQVYSPEISYTFFKNLIVSTDLDYTINSGLSAGYNQRITYWNASVALQVFKKKEGEIKLSVFDILRQNKSLSRSPGENYVQDVRSNVLPRYLMLSFTYNLRKGSQPGNSMPILPKQIQKTIRSMRMMN